MKQEERVLQHNAGIQSARIWTYDPELHQAASEISDDINNNPQSVGVSAAKSKFEHDIRHMKFSNKFKNDCHSNSRTIKSTNSKSPKSNRLTVNVNTPQTAKACKSHGKMLSSSKELRVYTNAHTQNQVYTCKICKKKFFSPALLHQHKKIHTKKQYACTKCEKRFHHKNIFKHHIKIHIEERPLL